MTARSLSAASALGAVLALSILALSLSGCALTAQVTTGKPYSPSDGIDATVSSVVAQNLLLVTTGEGEPAALLGALYNDSGDAVTVQVTVAQQNVSFTIPAKSTVILGLADGNQEFITESPVAPGLTADVTITVANRASSTKPLPVLDGTLPEYQGVLNDLAASGS